MKTMMLAFTAIGVIAVGSNLVLNEIGFSSQDRSTGSAVRLSN